MTVTSGGYARQVHLHVENTCELGPVFEASAQRVREAVARHPELRERVRITIGYDGDILDRELRSADALFCWTVDRGSLAERAPNLRWIHVHGAGVSHFAPLDELPRNVTLTNSRGVHGERATEYASMALLMLNNRIPEMVTNQREARWEQCFNSQIAGKTLLVVGVGNLGGNVARWAKTAGMRVLGIRRTARPHRYVDRMYGPDACSSLMPEVDFVAVCAPGTADTRHLIGRDEIALLKRGAGLVNFGRARVVDYEALRERLQRREMSAVLDVFDPEPLPASSPLWHTPNLIITPHSSSDDEDYYTPRTLDLVFENMKRFVVGTRLVNRVNKKRGY